MRVVLLTEAYLPIKNGVVHCVKMIRDELERLGHDVHIIAPDPHNVRIKDKRVHYVPALPFPGKSGYQMAFPAMSHVKPFLEKADIIHSHHPFTLGSWGQKIAKANNVPFVFTNHTQYLSYTHHVPVVGGVLKKPLAGYLQKFLNSCDIIVAPAVSTQKELEAQKIKVPVMHVPNGIELDRFSKGNGVELRKKLGISQTESVLVYTGRISEEKRVKFLIRSVASIKEAPKLIIAGLGPQLDEARDLVKELGKEDQIFLIGAVEYDEMPNVYAAGDVFATPSLSEVHPLVVIEAHVSGLPAVVVDAPGTADIVENGISGFVTKNTKADFVNGIRKIINNPGLKARLKRGAKKVGNKYSIESSVEKLLDVYNLAIRLKKD